MDVQNGIIEGVGFQTYGCGPAIAAASILTEIIKGKTLAEAGQIQGIEILGIMGDLPLGKHHCIDTAIQALADGLRKGVE